MITQCWIPNNNNMLFGVCHWQENVIITVGVILIPGFSQPKCDVDYFMSRLARRLSAQGIFVLQLDPIGHGDSPGDLESITFEQIRNDLGSGISYIRNKLNKDIPIFGISRGLNAVLLAEQSNLNAIAGISPYCIDGAVVKELWGGLPPGRYEIATLVNKEDKAKNAFFDSLGARETNLFGQKISTQIFEDLILYKPLEILNQCKNKSYWIFYSDSHETNSCQWSPDSYCTLEQYAGYSLPRIAMWQHNVIERLTSWTLEQLSKRGGN